MTPAIQLLLLALALGFGYLVGQWVGTDRDALAQKEAQAYADGFTAGKRSGRHDGWYAAHKLALDYLRDTPFSAPMKRLVKVLAAGEASNGLGAWGVVEMEPFITRPTDAPLKLVTTTTNAPAPVTLTGDGDE